MTTGIYNYDGPRRVCHEGHVYYDNTIFHEQYALPNLDQRSNTIEQTDDQLEVLISGGSMGGLFAAIAFRQAGHNVTVFERTEQGKMRERGAGIIAHPEMLTYLQRQGIAEWDDIATETVRIEHLDQEGEPVDIDGKAVYTTSWDTVYRCLKRALPDDDYRMGAETAAVEQDDAEVTVTFTDGRTATGDLLVAAEGYRSVTREQFLPEYTPEYAGYVAYRGTVPERKIPPRYETRFGDVYTLYHAPESQFLTYPVPGSDGETTKGDRRINWVWYYPFDQGEELDELLYDAEGTQRSHSLPPGLMRDSVREKQTTIATEILAPQLAWLVKKTAEPFVQCIYDVAVPRMVFDRVCIIGDAAFFIRPHMASGTVHAAADGLELAEAIYTGTDRNTALETWERKRVEAGYSLVEEARRRGDRYTGQF